ncbi:MAG: LamG-like jellyroll fold domain-containing protein [Prolixibacteraceae bacterium]
MKKTLCLLFVLVICSALQAQNSRRLDAWTFACVNAGEHTGQALQQGAKAVRFTRMPAAEQLRLIHSFFKQQQQSLILIFDPAAHNDSIKSFLQEQFKTDLFLNQDNEWPAESILQQKKIMALFGDDLTFTSSSRVTSSRAYMTRFSSDPLGKMVVFSPDSGDSLQSQCLQCWRLTGKVPNFVLLDPDELAEAEAVIEFLNNTRRLTGEVKYNGRLLNDVRWKQHPELITAGRFSYPVTGYSEILSPYKNGYRITPGEVIQHTGMSDALRTFTAFESQINEGLVMHFPFDGKIRNLSEPAWEKIIINQVEIVPDKERGRVARFTGNNAYIDYAKENNLNFDTPISMAVWVKPDTLNGFMGIVGLGSSFSLKLDAEGAPDFTTANIKDHKGNKTLEPGEWHHIAVVFNPGSTVDIYVDGEWSSTLEASAIKPSGQSFLIGSNLWGEQFLGSIDDLRIWDRGLSEKEIEAVFLEQDKAGNGLSLLYPALLICAAVLLVLVITRGIRRKTLVPAKAKTAAPGNSVKLFGTFQINTRNGGDQTGRFSPLLKQLLAFFILNQAETDDGTGVKKLTDTFWPGVEPDKARESRGTNLKKLRRLLESMEGISISYQDKKWFFVAGEGTSVDVFQYSELKKTIRQQAASGRVEHDRIIDFLEMVKAGNILQNIEAEWLDAHKSTVADEVIGLLFILLKSAGAQDLKIELARTVLKFDPVNEEALKQLLAGFTVQGNHGQARQCYDDFCRKYVLLYNEPYPVAFRELIKK